MLFCCAAEHVAAASCNFVSSVHLQTVQFVQYLYSKCAVLLCSWTCSSSFCFFTLSTVQLQSLQFVQYLYSKCAVLLCSWTCSSSFCVITVSTVQFQSLQFVQYICCAVRRWKWQALCSCVSSSRQQYIFTVWLFVLRSGEKATKMIPLESFIHLQYQCQFAMKYLIYNFQRIPIIESVILLSTSYI